MDEFKIKAVGFVYFQALLDFKERNIKFNELGVNESGMLQASNTLSYLEQAFPKEIEEYKKNPSKYQTIE